mmetsp:Transcript_17132/g.23544  ORF Transcript_17132/g.23544 Transcript_17132/m.23544 type:complete len:485 (-) Transcript_17132:162-1616(-)|eukprot:CAMPEP_0185731138 /NCGR_PEP_ID=MMETSP1171-20130828/11973_1 /TAXON_ID=374046 /ORGANISM="Helicotheca tamensis, Strain CCMP826" /LENGTH=484 /DNA_ID=CAMNT_0028400335 /DNA_START=146 /DNA_END=1600 /DNA_ORIENTATION=+
MLLPRLPSTTLFLSALILAVYQDNSFHEVNAFTTHLPSSTRFAQHKRNVISARIQKKLFMSYNEDDDFDDEDDDDIIDPNTLGDWRQFRMNLAETGLSSTPSTAEEGWIDDDGKVIESSSSTSSSDMSNNSAAEEKKRPKSVSKKNEELLKSQNEELAEEYITGVWAHEAPVPEVGGLVCRLPLEAEIYRNERRSNIGKMLRQYLESDDYDSASTTTNNKKEEEKQRGGSVSFSPLAAKTVFWYRGAQNLVKKELEKITSSAQNGRIDPSSLSDESQELLQLYLDNQDSWQEVCLVIDRNEQVGKTTTLVLNRPMAFKVTEMLGRLVLFGANAGEDESQTEKLGRFLTAFGTDCAIYVGGPDNMGEPSTMIHGIQDLPGAREVSPGSGIYTGGLDAAVAGVLAGKYDPLDFRFFVGKHDYKEGQLDGEVLLGKYQPVACARALALKQCIQLPKPLWHEVLELCGGELKEISSLEFMKRVDLGIE